jgi:hypothetical protein
MGNEMPKTSKKVKEIGSNISTLGCKVSVIEIVHSSGILRKLGVDTGFLIFKD